MYRLFPDELGEISGLGIMFSKLNLTSDEKKRHRKGTTYSTTECCKDLHFSCYDGVINLQVGSVLSFYHHEAEEASCHRHKILEAARTNQ